MAHDLPDPMASVAREVREHWSSQGLAPSAIPPMGARDVLKRLYPCGWDDYEVFLGVAGLPAQQDRNGIRFWLPHDLRLAGEVLADAGYRCDTTHPAVVFADYLHESYWYCLWLEGPFAGRVSLVLGTADGSDPQPPLGSLVDFLRAYLADDERMYPASRDANQ